MTATTSDTEPVGGPRPPGTSADGTPADPDSSADGGPAADALDPRRGRLLARRVLTTLGSSALLLWAVATIVFFLQHLVPGDPAQTILGGASANPPEETLQAVREQYGFD